MLREITAKQFVAWGHYDQIEPFGELRADMRAAQIVQTILNVNLGKNQKPYALKDVLIKFEEAVSPEKKKKQSWQEQLALLKLFAKVHAATGE